MLHRTALTQLEADAKQPPGHPGSGRPTQAAADGPRQNPEQEPGARTRGSDCVSGSPASGIGIHQGGIWPSAHQPEDQDDFLHGDELPPGGALLVAFNLLGNRMAQAEPLGSHFAGQVGEPVIERRVEVPDRLEQALRNEGMKAVQSRGGSG